MQELSGTTAVVLLYKFDETNKVLGKLWAANVGDSRAVLSSQNSKVTDLTIDQKPNSPLEQERIRKAGGFVSPPEEEWGGPARVWLDANMTLPGLAMARSIGDHLVDKVGVVAEPEVSASEAERDVGGIWELEGIAPKSRGGELWWQARKRSDSNELHLLLIAASSGMQVTDFLVDTTKDDMIVMASDGVWEFIESDQACKLLMKVR